MPRTSAGSSGEFAHVFLGIFQPHLRILVVVHERRHDDIGKQRWGVPEREKISEMWFRIRDMYQQRTV
jgi:hypothetical protein